MALDHLVTDPKPATGREPMQRIRTGVTGLAAIVLLVALATAIASGVQHSANATDAAASATPVADLSNNKAEKSEPLAQLGVTPPVESKVPPAPPGSAKH